MEDGFVPKKYDQDIKARAVRMVRDHLPTYSSVTRAADAVGPQLGISGNSLRRVGGPGRRRRRCPRRRSESEVQRSWPG
jgi:hypothetical protein